MNTGRPTTPRFGALRSLLAAVRAGDGLWVHPDWMPLERAPLEEVLDAGNSIAYAPWKWASGVLERPPQPRIEALLARPAPLGVIAWRGSALRDIDWPDPGPADLVLDAAADWALAVMALARGVAVGAAVEPASVRLAMLPEHPDRLREDGKRWLRERAQRWTAAAGAVA